MTLIYLLDKYKMNLRELTMKLKKKINSIIYNNSNYIVILL